MKIPPMLHLAWALMLGGCPALLQAAAIAVQDDTGHPVVLAVPARRIVSLAPHATELLFAAGAGPQVVAVSRYSDYPPEARRLPQIGDSSRIDLEKIASLHPDLVVAWGSALPERMRQALQTLRIPVYLSEPARLADLVTSVRTLGRLAGAEEAARAAASALERRIERLRTAHAGPPSLTVFFQIWPSPLMTINRRQVISDVLGLCGARNLFDPAALQVATVDPEAVVAADPDVIATGVEAGEDAATSPAFARWRAMPHLRAVASGQLIALPADLIARPGPRLVDAAEILCAALDRVRSRLRGQAPAASQLAFPPATAHTP